MRSPEGKYHGILQQLVERLEKVVTRVKKLESNRQLFDITNEFSPTLIAASPQNDYDAGNYDILRITAGQATTITGIAGGKKGRFLEIYNASVFSLTFPHENTGSLETNRFATPGGTSKTVTSLQRLRLYYDSTLQRWSTG